MPNMSRPKLACKVRCLVATCLVLVATWVVFSASPAFAKDVRITLVQANDVYEMTPVNGSRYGGFARLQTLVKQLRAENPNTYTILAGDLLSPSAIGNAKVDGERLHGKQMVDVLNVMGWNFMTLGNHEFDNGRDSLIARLSEAKFKIVSSNVIDTATGIPFPHTERTALIEVDGVRIGLGGITLQSLSRDFVTVLAPFTEARAVLAELKSGDSADIVILLTHQAIDEDVQLAERLPGIALIVGGHEHINYYRRRGPDFTPIAKADSNARTVYIHDLTYDTETRALNVESRLQIVDSSFNEDPEIAKRVDFWVEKTFAALRADGFRPDAVIAKTDVPLDGLESSVRFKATRLTDLIAQSAVRAFPGSQLSLVNAGGIRIDDVLPAGDITQYDIVRILPFGGDYVEVEMPGDILRRALDIGQKNKGIGSFLIHANISSADGGWRIGDRPLSDQTVYKVAIAAFLVDQGDTGLEFLVNNPKIKRISPKGVDTRFALIDELSAQYPPR